MKNKPHWQILLSLVLATATAIVFRQLADTQEATAGFIGNVMLTCEFVGKLFMNLLKMIIVPLVVSSVVAGIASLHGMKGFGRLLGKNCGLLCYDQFDGDYSRAGPGKYYSARLE